MNDGICDCCDGADEPSTGVCKDDCDAILAEERRLRKELADKFKAGSQIRERTISDFQRVREEKLEEIKKTESDLVRIEGIYNNISEKYRALELEWIKNRLSAVENGFQAVTGSSDSPVPGLKGMLEPLTSEELTWWIIHACQFSGELMIDDGFEINPRNSKTCIPLRMAGLDSRIWWEPKTYQMTAIHDDDDDNANLSILAKLWDYNLKNPKSSDLGSQSIAQILGTKSSSVG